MVLTKNIDRTLLIVPETERDTIAALVERVLHYLGFVPAGIGRTSLWSLPLDIEPDLSLVPSERPESDRALEAGGDECPCEDEAMSVEAASAIVLPSPSSSPRLLLASSACWRAGPPSGVQMQE